MALSTLFIFAWYAASCTFSAAYTLTNRTKLKLCSATAFAEASSSCTCSESQRENEPLRAEMAEEMKIPHSEMSARWLLSEKIMKSPPRA